jgi:hypothetical protein
MILEQGTQLRLQQDLLCSKDKFSALQSEEIGILNDRVQVLSGISVL